MAGFMREARAYPRGRGRVTALPRDQRRASRRSPPAGTRSTPRSPRTSCSASSCRTCAATAATCSRWSGTGRCTATSAPVVRRGAATVDGCARHAPTNASARWATCRRSGRTRSRSRARRAAGSTCSSGGGAVRSASSRRPRCATPRTGSRSRGAAPGTSPAAASRTTTSDCPTSARRTRSTEPGDWIRQPALARTIRALADDGPDAYYKGAIADAIVAQAARRRLVHDGRRPRRARGRVGRAAARDVRGSRVAELPPPTQGVTALEALRIVDGFDLPTRRRSNARTS